MSRSIDCNVYAFGPAVTLPVHNIDTGLDYATIQEAIDAPETLDGHIIMVDAGMYYENVVVDKSLSLVGWNKTTTIIDGTTGIVVNVTSNNVKVSGFTIQSKSGTSVNTGICISEWSTGSNVIYNIIRNNGYGITLDYSSSYNIISENDITNNDYGIHLFNSSHNTLSGNNIAENGKDGIHLYKSSNHNTISGNSIIANKNDGISIYDSSHNSVFGNKMVENLAGIFLYASSSNSVSKNNITANNDYGISVRQSSDYNNIYENEIADNHAGIYVDTSSSNTIYYNSFSNNTEQVIIDASSNIWHNDHPSGGNYWSDYEERYPDAEELDHSGIWNTPYVINANNRDNYPLISPYTPLPTTNYVDPRENVVNVGESFNVNINAGNAANLYASQFKLNWDPNLLDVTNVSEGSFLREKGDTYYLVKLSKEEGYLLSSYSFLGPVEPINGTGPILTLEFYAKNPGQTTLSLSDTPFGTADGTVTIQGTSTSSHTSDANTQIIEQTSNKVSSTTSGVWKVGQDLSSLQEAIDAASPGDTIHVQAGTYLENIVVDKPLTIIGEGGSSTIIRSLTRDQISTAAVDIEAHGVTITGFSIQGGYTGIRCYSGWDYLSIADNSFVDNFVAIATVGLVPDFSTDNWLANNYIINNNCGIFVWVTDDTVVETNDVYSNGIGIQINGPVTSNRVFHNNMVNNVYHQAYGGAEYTVWDDGYPSGGNYWSDHELVDQYRGPDQEIPGPDGICDTAYILNADNRDRYPLVTQFSAHRVHNVDTSLDYAKIQEAIDAPETLDGHTLEVDAGTYYEAVTVHKSLSLIGGIKHTTIIEGGGSDEPAFRVAAVSNVFISGFTLQNFTTGVSIENSNSTIVEDNIITTCGAGIVTLTLHNSAASNNRIAHNVIAQNNQGVSINGVLGSSDGNIIIDNRIDSNNIGIGFYGPNSRGNNVTLNSFTNSQYGVYLDLSSGTSNNFFFHNNFIGNKQQVYNNPARPSVNVWDDGYPSGGNYWGDYTGADEFGGPYQNMTGSDGIGDAPYVIDADNRDNYPLKTPCVNLVSILNISASKAVTNDTIVYVTVVMHVSDDYHEQLDVSAFYNSTLIATKTAGNEAYSFAPLVVFPFRLNTTLTPKGSYLLSANVCAVPGETYTTDNTYTGSMFKEVMRGNIDGNAVVNIIDIATVAVAYNSSTLTEDINRDGIVDEIDFYIVAFAINTEPGHPRWNPDADINNDGRITLAPDLTSVVKKFGLKAAARWNPNADWDGNGVINIIDVTAAAVNFGKTDYY